VFKKVRLAKCFDYSYVVDIEPETDGGVMTLAPFITVERQAAMRSWAAENAQGSYSFRVAGVGGGKGRHSVWRWAFERESDAVMFKMNFC
jgi:hypothetical protein